MTTKDYLEKDYYKVLGVPKDADAAAIKRAYRALARKNHPDANGSDKASEAKFKQISEAYDVLSAPDKRKEYDEARSLFGGGGFRVPTGAGPNGSFNVDLGDIFGGRGDRLGDIFGGLFGNRPAPGTPGTARTQAPRRGADVESEVTLAFDDAVDGATVTLRMTGDAPCAACGGTGAKAGTMPRVCPTCDGAGMTTRSQGGFALSEPCRDCRGRGLVVDEACPVCVGSGRAPSSRTMNVRIPAGVRDGQRIRLKGKGTAGERGGAPGDLYVLVHVRPHPVFGRKNDNLTVTVPITFPEAALGADIKVPTLGASPVTVKVPPGTPNDRTFRVKGRGVRRIDGTRGDLLVTVEVVVPDHIDDDTKAALEKLRGSGAGDNVRARLVAEANVGADTGTAGPTTAGPNAGSSTAGSSTAGPPSTQDSSTRAGGSR